MQLYVLVSLPFRLFDSIEAVKSLGIVDLGAARDLLASFIGQVGVGMIKANKNRAPGHDRTSLLSRGIVEV